MTAPTVEDRPAAPPLRIALDAATARLGNEPIPSVALFEWGDVVVELFAPRGVDRQQPHDRDEVYIVVSGSGTFRRDDEGVTFGPGDLLFVPAGAPHRFETFTDDFRTWVIFFDPVGGACNLPGS